MVIVDASILLHCCLAIQLLLKLSVLLNILPIWSLQIMSLTLHRYWLPCSIGATFIILRLAAGFSELLAVWFEDLGSVHESSGVRRTGWALVINTGDGHPIQQCILRDSFGTSTSRSRPWASPNLGTPLHDSQVCVWVGG